MNVEADESGPSGPTQIERLAEVARAAWYTAQAGRAYVNADTIWQATAREILVELREPNYDVLLAGERCGNWRYEAATFEEDEACPGRCWRSMIDHIIGEHFYAPGC